MWATRRTMASGMARRGVATKAVTYERLGAVENVVKAADISVGDSLQAKQVLVKMIAAPVGAVDIHAIAGRIPGVNGKGVCGNEGVGVVEQVGSSVSGLKKGDHVVPAKLGMGTWANYAVADEAALVAVPKDVDAKQAAFLAGAPATAFAVLGQVGSLQSGDAVIINGGNTMLGLAAVQIAKAKGIKVISVVNDGVADYKGVVGKLQGAGSEVVIDEGSAGSSNFRKVCADLKPKLAIHCSSSSAAATDIARALAPGGVLVAVAGAGPVTVPSSLLIDRNISVRGFRNENPSAAIKELAAMVKSGKLNLPIASTESLGNYSAAIKAASAQPFGGVLFTM